MNSDSPGYVDRVAREKGVRCQAAYCTRCHWQSNPYNDFDTRSRLFEKMDHEQHTGHRVIWEEGDGPRR